MTTTMTYLDSATATEIRQIALADAREIRWELRPDVDHRDHTAILRSSDRLQYTLRRAMETMTPARYRRLAAMVHEIAPSISIPR